MEPTQLGNNYDENFPTNVRENKIRQINIEQLNYGYLVTIDCHKFAISSREKLIESLNSYILNPLEKEEQWFNTKSL